MISAFTKLALACFFFLTTIQTAYAATPPTPVLGETDWRTGEIEVCWSNVVPTYTLILYTKTYKDSSFMASDAWTADTATGCHVTSYFENGQTVWHYITQTNPQTAEVSEPSNTGKQTPPITAYIINWPDMLNDLKSMSDAVKQAIADGAQSTKDAIDNANQALKDKLDQLATPSDSAMQNLKGAVDDLKNSTGSSSAGSAGQSLIDGFNDTKAGLKPPVMPDDGVGTFTGGSAPDTLPSISGTANDLTFCFHLTKKMDGSWFDACILNNEQLEKMKWMDNLRKLIGYTIYITFAVWLVTRFTPQFKV